MLIAMFLAKFPSIVPLVTPFNPDLGVDYAALERLVDWQVESGTDALLCFGTTGEGCLLSEKEKEAVLSFVVGKVSGRIPVIANTGTNCTIESVRLTEMAKKVGASGCLAIVPYYVMPTEKGVVAHLNQIERVGLPVIVYHHPGRTQIKLSYETIAHILTWDTVVGLKDCSGDSMLMQKLAHQFQKKIIFSGIDTQLLEDLECGAGGSITPMGNLIPSEWKRIVSTCDRELFSQYVPLMEAIYADVNPQGIKCALAISGKIQNELRLPLLPSENEALIRSKIESVEALGHLAHR